MSKTTEVTRYLLRRPHAAATAHITGKLPRAEEVGSPLIKLLESIPARDRALKWRGIRLSPKLGYLDAGIFANAAILLQWLKPKEYLVGSETTPAESRRLKQFNKSLTLADLACHANVHPEQPAPMRGR